MFKGNAFIYAEIIEEADTKQWNLKHNYKMRNTHGKVIIPFSYALKPSLSHLMNYDATVRLNVYCHSAMSSFYTTETPHRRSNTWYIDQPTYEAG